MDKPQTHAEIDAMVKADRTAQQITRSAWADGKERDHGKPLTITPAGRPGKSAATLRKAAEWALLFASVWAIIFVIACIGAAGPQGGL